MTDPWSGWDQRWATTAVAKPVAPTVDVHSHLLVPQSAEIALARGGKPRDARALHSSPESLALNKGYFDLVRDRFTNPEARLEDMDRMGIDMQVISLAPPQYFYWLDNELAPPVAAMQNDRIAEVVGHHPERFAGLGTLPMRHPAECIAEIHRICADLRFPGVELGADIDGIDLDDRKFDPVWDLLAGVGMVVMIHPAGFPEAARLTDYYLVNVVGIPLSSTVAVTRMILGGVLERHPGLKVLVCHGGGYLPLSIDRTDHAFKHRPEVRRHITKPPSEYLRQLYFDSMVFEPATLKQLVSRVGDDRVLLGTDYPFDMGEGDPLALVAASELTSAQVRRITGENAVELLKLTTGTGANAD